MHQRHVFAMQVSSVVGSQPGGCAQGLSFRYHRWAATGSAGLIIPKSRPKASMALG